MVTKIKNNNIYLLDIFSGAGGFSLGFKQAGFKIAGAIDYHEDPLKTFKFNHPEATIIKKNIREIRGKEIGKELSNNGFNKIDIIIGGPPCKGFSLRGKRKIDDPRNNLVLEYFRLINELKPEIFVFENVTGLIASKMMKLFKKLIINQIKKMDYNYAAKILTSSDYGVPQIRKRFFLIGKKKKESEIYFPKTSIEQPEIIKKINFKNKKEPEYGEIKDLEDLELLDQNKILTVADALDDIANKKNKKMKVAYKVKSINPSNIYLKFLRNGSNSELIDNHRTTNHSKRLIKRFQHMEIGKGMESVPKHLRVNRRSVKKLCPNKPAPTVTCSNEDMVHYKVPRILTIREMARLQSFPDSYIFKGTPTTGGPRRKVSVCQVQQVGNSVPPLLANAVAEGVLKIFEKKSNNFLNSFIKKLNNRTLKTK